RTDDRQRARRRMGTMNAPFDVRSIAAEAVADVASRQEARQNPSLSILRLHRRQAVPLPLDAFGPFWQDWICRAAEGAACPADYVALPLLAAASALIGNARWPMAWAGWAEPPVLWCASVGDP